MVTININGNAFETEDDMTILDVAGENNINIPSHCTHDMLPPAEKCKLCTVEVSHQGETNIELACEFHVKNGIKIITESKKIKIIRDIAKLQLNL